MDRRIAACLHADIKGYSRLIADDVEGTVRMLTECQHVIGNSVEVHGGRVVDLAGDSLLAEFATVTTAVRCAIDIQRLLRARNAGLPPHRRMEFRVGIDLGHVLVVGGRLYGDCVNVAARVQEMAAPGSICLAGSAFDHVEDSLAVRFEYLGERTVKNMEKPLRVYRIDGYASESVCHGEGASGVGCACRLIPGDNANDRLPATGF